MEALGAQLTTARAKLGIAPGEAAARLRIRTSFVEAMEREDWGVVGAPVYVRGFLRNYARLLGLDPERVLALLPDSQQPAAPIVEPIHFENHVSGYRDRPLRAAPWYPWVLGALTVVASVLVINVAIGLYTILSPANRSVNPTATQNANAAFSPDQTTSNTLQAAAAAQSHGGVNLRLQLTQPSWLSVTVDGKRVVYETLPAGTVRLFHGDREISLRAGNAGGVVANFDGKDLGTLGTAGQVEDRVFAAKAASNQLTGPHE
jgi:cytoskeleton protein RodZ